MGEIAFHEAANLWNRQSIASRRFTLRLLAQNEVLAETLFDRLPTSTRDALITDWEKNNLDKHLKTRVHTCQRGVNEPCQRCVEFKEYMDRRFR